MKKKIPFLFVSTYFCLLFSISSAQTNWMQVGNDIYGESNSDGSHVVSINADGSIIAVGAPYNSDSESGAGHVRVFQLQNNNWLQVGQAILGGEDGDHLGSAVCLNSAGDIIAIGAPNDDNDVGYVGVYQYSGGNWTQLGLNIHGSDNDNYSGSSVSLNASGDILAIGAPNNYINGATSGQVRIFHFIDDNWTQLGSDILGESPGDYCGRSGSISLSDDGNIIAVGSYLSQYGHVRIFEYAGGDWAQEGASIFGESTNDSFGISLDLNGDGTFIAIGATGNDGNGNNSGHVRVFQNIADNWTQIGNDIDGEASDDKSGISVGLSSDGNTVIVGACENAEIGYDKGHARVFEYVGGDWEQIGEDIDGESNFDEFGRFVDIDDSGDRIIIGSRYNDLGGPNSGLAKVYRKCSNSYYTHSVTGCVSYTWIDGTTYTMDNNTATHIIPNSFGCDSIITLDLTIIDVDTSVNVSMNSLSANATDATFQWVDCDNSYAPVVDETDQTFTTDIAGNFAVEVTQNGCTYRSSCYNIFPYSIEEWNQEVKIFPNPSTGKVNISLDKNVDVWINVYNSAGTCIYQKGNNLNDNIQFEIKGSPGVYIVEILYESKVEKYKLVKI